MMGRFNDSGGWVGIGRGEREDGWGQSSRHKDKARCRMDLVRIAAPPSAQIAEWQCAYDSCNKTAIPGGFGHA